MRTFLPAAFVRMRVCSGVIRLVVGAVSAVSVCVAASSLLGLGRSGEAEREDARGGVMTSVILGSGAQIAEQVVGRRKAYIKTEVHRVLGVVIASLEDGFSVEVAPSAG